MRIAVIFGTRPEAIKMAPVVRELRTNSRAKAAFETLVFVTAQHREMLDQVLAHFEIEPDADLDIMRPGQDLAGLTARLIESLDGLLSETAPDLVLVHGDTTTASPRAWQPTTARSRWAMSKPGCAPGTGTARFPRR